MINSFVKCDVQFSDRDVIYKTRNTVSDHILRTPRRRLKIPYDAQRSIFDELRSVWKCDQTASLEFEISFTIQYKLNDTS